MAAYGVDVLDPATTPRRLAVLAEHLPPWARLPGEQWSVEAELLAVLVDSVAQLTYVTLRASGAKSVRKPKPLPRPARRAARAPTASSGPRAAASGPDAPEKTASWLDAAAQLAAIPGVTVQAEGGDPGG
jgi:hypothetical protein